MSTATLDGKNRNPKVFDPTKNFSHKDFEKFRRTYELEESQEDEIDAYEGITNFLT